MKTSLLFPVLFLCVLGGSGCKEEPLPLPSGPVFTPEADLRLASAHDFSNIRSERVLPNGDGYIVFYDQLPAGVDPNSDAALQRRQVAMALLDRDGNLISQTLITQADYFRINDSKPSPDGNFLLAGAQVNLPTLGGINRMWLRLVNPEGQAIWNKIVDKPRLSVLQTSFHPNGDIYGLVDSAFYPLLIHWDAQGNELNRLRLLPYSLQGFPSFDGVMVLPNGNVMVYGESIIAFDPGLQAPEWTYADTMFQFYQWTQFVDAKLTGDGNLLMLGRRDINQGTNSDIVLLGLSPEGQELSQVVIDRGPRDQPAALSFGKQDEILILHDIETAGPPPKVQTELLAADRDGNELWANKLFTLSSLGIDQGIQAWALSADRFGVFASVISPETGGRGWVIRRFTVSNL